MIAKVASTAAEQEKLRRHLGPDGVKSLMDLAIDSAGYLVNRLIRKPISSPWVSAIVFVTLTFLAFALCSSFYEQPLRILLFWHAFGFLVIFIFGMSAIYYRGLRGFYCETVISSTVLAEDVADLRDRFSDSYNLGRAVACSSLFSFVLLVLAGLVLPENLKLTSGIVAGLLLIGFLCGALVFYYISHLGIVSRLGRYRFKLHPVDPASSEVLYRIKQFFTRGVYRSSILASAFTFLLSIVFGIFNWRLMVFGLMVFWTFPVGRFVVLHRSLDTIIRNAKWRIVSEIQSKIDDLGSEGGLLAEDSFGHLVKMLDYHDRVWRTRDTLLDLRAILHLSSSLLLPVITAALGNFGKSLTAALVGLLP